MTGLRRFPAFGLALLAVVAVTPARAWIDTDPSAVPGADPAPQSVLRVQGAKVPEMPQVVVVQQEMIFRAPTPFPGGCFNCSTLNSNQGNVAQMFGRAHGFSQNLFSSPSGPTFVILPQ